MRLSQETIHEILIAYNDGETRSAIAKRFSVDGSTVRYHVEKFENLYGSTQAVYALVKPKPKPCSHPSLRCFVCGVGQDNMRRRELETITALKTALTTANERLVRSGFQPVDITEV